MEKLRFQFYKKNFEKIILKLVFKFSNKLLLNKKNINQFINFFYIF